MNLIKFLKKLIFKKVFNGSIIILKKDNEITIKLEYCMNLKY